MQTKERIFHAVSFEALALAIIIPVTSLITGKGTSDLALVGIGLSLFTVIWNYAYNIAFDRLCAVPRQQRTFRVRLLHTFGFEGGLIFITVPSIAWFLAIGLLESIMLEAGFLVFFFFYATGFNWCYDRVQPYRWLTARV